MVGTSRVKVDALALDGLEHRVRIEAFEHVHGAAADQRRQHLGAGDMADRRHREIAPVIWNFEVGSPGALARHLERGAFDLRRDRVLSVDDLVARTLAEHSAVSARAR
jgi:hypothetical protein